MKALFIGTKSFGLRAFVRLRAAFPETFASMLTLDDRRDGRSAFDSISRHCRDHGVTLHVAERAADAKAVVFAEQPDVCLVVGWYSFFDAATLSIPRHGFVGVHNSLLPKYRGGAPLVWALINGEMLVGSSIFRMGIGMDDGDVLEQYSFGVLPNETVGELLAQIENTVVGDLPRAWLKMKAKGFSGRTQDHAQATYCGQRRPEDGEIDWKKSALKVHNFIRAQSPPYPCAFTRLDESKVHIMRSRPFGRPYHGTPGQVLRVDGDHAVVACGGDSAVVVESVLRGGESVAASSVLRSMRIRLGRPTPLTDEDLRRMVATG